MNIQEDWKTKLESAYSFVLKYYNITASDRPGVTMHPAQPDK